MKRIAIIGGGISGLSAAYTLEEKRQSGTPVEYVLFESSPRLGGVLVTDHVDGCIIEAGPDSFLTEKPWATDLCRKIGLGDQLIGSNDSDRKTYICYQRQTGGDARRTHVHGAHQDHAHRALAAFFLCAQNFAWRPNGFIHRAKPPRTKPWPQMVERHYGSEMVDCSPIRLLSGVYGGEASQLSVRAVLPRFADMESQTRQPGPRHARIAQENGSGGQRPRAPAVHFAQRRHAADDRRPGGAPGSRKR